MKYKAFAIVAAGETDKTFSVISPLHTKTYGDNFLVLLKFIRILLQFILTVICNLSRILKC